MARKKTHSINEYPLEQMMYANELVEQSFLDLFGEDMLDAAKQNPYIGESVAKAIKECKYEDKKDIVIDKLQQSNLELKAELDRLRRQSRVAPAELKSEASQCVDIPKTELNSKEDENYVEYHFNAPVNVETFIQNQGTVNNK